MKDEVMQKSGKQMKVKAKNGYECEFESVRTVKGIMELLEIQIKCNGHSDMVKVEAREVDNYKEDTYLKCLEKLYIDASEKVRISKEIVMQFLDNEATYIQEEEAQPVLYRFYEKIINANNQKYIKVVIKKDMAYISSTDFDEILSTLHVGNDFKKILYMHNLLITSKHGRTPQGKQIISYQYDCDTKKIFGKYCGKRCYTVKLDELKKSCEAREKEENESQNVVQYSVKEEIEEVLGDERNSLVAKCCLMPYYGGKRNMIPEIFYACKDIPNRIDTIVESFAGSGVLSFNVDILEELRNRGEHFKIILNDLNKANTLLFNIIADANKSEQLLNTLKSSYTEEEFNEAVYIVKKYNNNNYGEIFDEVEVAVAVLIKYYLSFNSGGKDYVKDHKINIDNIRKIKELMEKRTIEVTVLDAVEIIEKYKGGPNTLLLIDPPYIAETRVSPDVYEYEASEVPFHKKLAEHLVDANAYVILFGYRGKKWSYEDILTDWEYRILGRYNKPSRNKKGSLGEEFIWANFPLYQKAEGSNE